MGAAMSTYSEPGALLLGCRPEKNAGLYANESVRNPDMCVISGGLLRKLKQAQSIEDVKRDVPELFVSSVADFRVTAGGPAVESRARARDEAITILSGFGLTAVGMTVMTAAEEAELILASVADVIPEHVGAFCFCGTGTIHYGYVVWVDSRPQAWYIRGERIAPLQDETPELHGAHLKTLGTAIAEVSQAISMTTHPTMLVAGCYSMANVTSNLAEFTMSTLAEATREALGERGAVPVAIMQHASDYLKSTCAGGRP